MPRLNNDGRDRLTGSQRMSLGKLLMEAYALASFDNLLGTPPSCCRLRGRNGSAISISSRSPSSSNSSPPS
jgi:hypothetical protein